MIQMMDKITRFWGPRSGMISKTGEPVFKIKKWGNGSNNASTPDRRRKGYQNKKLARRRGWN